MLERSESKIWSGKVEQKAENPKKTEKRSWFEIWYEISFEQDEDLVCTNLTPSVHPFSCRIAFSIDVHSFH